ncbi:undecaprenyl-diphosphate phosphatase [Acidisoma cellulosilytica]|uniref:Undecaprenyl-diphosphatase n=1 Tax=Acidisoma cellulosilyticum TaxID=2802395 RepID=A0A964E367_9PROT|nr:undecaprenyl-diphosphate phosphatase [Acidisoma cellulosilyticum]MCB8879528.1 undecaprenyl-diphosphate phosphatase [Acidisoma cellulosilyticum]
MDPIQAIVIAVVQGATELFPVSSLGHAVILPALLHWNLDQHGDNFLPFLVMLHVGTALALLGFFWRDWLAILRGLIGIGSAHEVAEARRVFLLIVIATIPVVILGGGLEHLLRRVFATPLIAAIFLVVNGLVLLVGEKLKGSKASTLPLSKLGARDAFIIGCWQCLALIPGMSRSGASILGGVLRGLDHEDSAHFSFLIALPVIVAAAVLEVPKLMHDHAAQGTMSLAVIAAVVAGVTALASTAFLMRWFRGHQNWAMTPFAIYCIVAGVLSAGFLVIAG